MNRKEDYVQRMILEGAKDQGYFYMTVDEVLALAKKSKTIIDAIGSAYNYGFANGVRREKARRKKAAAAMKG